MDLQPKLLVLSQENEEQDMVAGPHSSTVFRVTSSSVVFTETVCSKIKFKVSRKFSHRKENVKVRRDLCGLSEDLKIFKIGFDLLLPGLYKVVVFLGDSDVTNSPFKFKVTAAVEVDNFKDVGNCSLVCSPLTPRLSSIEKIPCSTFNLVANMAARTEPIKSSFVINEGVRKADLHRPIGLCLLNNGNLVVASTFEDKVKIYLPSGELQSIVQIPGRRFKRPTDMTALANGQFAVRDRTGVMVFSSEGSFLWKPTYWKETGDGSQCFGLAQDDSGHLVAILESGKGQVPSLIFFDLNTRKITYERVLDDVVRVEDLRRSKCRFLTYSEGLFYVTDLGMDQIYVLDSNAKLVRKFGNTGDGPGQFNDPAGLGVDGEGNVVVADSKNHRLCLYTKEGEYVQNLELSPNVMKPSGFLLDRVNKEMYVLNLNGPRAMIKYSLQ